MTDITRLRERIIAAIDTELPAYNLPVIYRPGTHEELKVHYDNGRGKGLYDARKIVNDVFGHDRVERPEDV